MERIKKIVENVDSIMGTVTFIRDEIKRLNVSEDIKNDVLEITESFESLYYVDIRKEVNDLSDELLSDKPRKEIIKMSISAIGDDLWSEIEKMKSLIEKLESHSDPGMALMLVRCHAADIIVSYRELKSILDSIEAALGP